MIEMKYHLERYEERKKEREGNHDSMLTRYPPVVPHRYSARGRRPREEKAQSDSSCPDNVIIVTPLTCVVCLQPVNLQPVLIPLTRS